VILVGHRGAKEGQEARTGHGVDDPAIPLDLLLGQGVQGAHLAVERIQPQARLERRGLGQGTPEQRDQFPLTDEHALVSGPGGLPWQSGGVWPQRSVVRRRCGRRATQRHRGRLGRGASSRSSTAPTKR
jgi:hypothetical protein